MKQLLFLAAFGAISVVSACGFRPVYATPSSGAISVQTIPGRSGHALRKALLHDLAAGLPGDMQGATLSVQLSESLTQLAFTTDGAASRSSVRARGSYVLSYNGGAVSGFASSEATFNVPVSPYGDISAQVAASERAMNELSRVLVEDMRIKLSQAQ